MPRAARWASADALAASACPPGVACVAVGRWASAAPSTGRAWLGYPWASSRGRRRSPVALAPGTAGRPDAGGPKPVRDPLPPPCVVQRRVKTPPVGIASPGAVTLCTPHRARLHRGVRAAAGAGTGRDPEKFWLGDGV